MNHLKICCFALALLLTRPSARADVRIYTDRSAFDAASQSLQAIDFSGYAEGSGQWYQYYGDHLTIDGVTFISQLAYGYTDYGNLYVANLSTYASSPVLWNYDVSLPLIVSLPPGTTAFGADYSATTQYADYPGTPDSFLATISFTDGSSFSFVAQRWSELTFFGFTSDTPISSFTYSDGGTFYGLHNEVMDNVEFGIAVIPEPEAVNLFLLAGVAFAVCRARRPDEMSGLNPRAVFALVSALVIIGVRPASTHRLTSAAL